MRWTYPYADAVVAVSGGVADDLSRTIRLARDRIRVIYNPVLTREMLEMSHDEVEYPWIGAGKPVILAVGRLVEQKDFPTLVRAFAKVRRDRDAYLVILGEGEERAHIEQIARELGLQESVFMPGFVSNPYACMRQATILALPSRWEGFGNVVVEAMACGTPVVASDCRSGPAEILEDGKWGELFPVGDSNAMAAAILRVLDGRRPDVEVRAQAFSAAPIAALYLRELVGSGGEE
jgi:glycosyltransferase involved in cell wall biosynthesis